MKKRRPLVVEHLESRLTPTTRGVPWPAPQHLTLSFVPDGTDVGGAPSNLFQTMNAQAPTSTWETAILKAFQTWAATANIDISVVADGGEPLGTTGAPQGDPRFGDIRIAARPGTNDVAATSSPFDWTGTTWAGDVILNSSMNIGVGSQSQYDLYTVALHEAGHVLGFPANDDPQSIMYQTYEGASNGLSPEDIAAVQALYGARIPEPNHNGSFGSATQLGLLASTGSTVSGALNTSSDVNYYKFVAPLSLGLINLNVQLQTSANSMLESQVTIYNGAHQVVGSATAMSPVNGNLSIPITGLWPLSTYYVKVTSATNTVFGVGSYQLSINSLVPLSSLVNELGSSLNNLSTSLITNLDLNGSPLTATLLSPVTGLVSPTDPRFDAFITGSIAQSSYVDYYRISAPGSNTSGPVTLTAMAWGIDYPNPLHPIIHIFDANDNPLPVQVITNGGGTYTIQLTNVQPNTSYFVEIMPMNSSGSNSTGNYALAIDFHSTAPVTLQTFGSNQLSQSNPQDSAALVVSQTTLFHFALAADADSSDGAVNVTMTITDQNGNVLFNLTSQAGKPSSTGDIYLQVGSYTITYAAQAVNGGAIPAVEYWLEGESDSGPIGAMASNSTNAPVGPSNGSGGYTYTGSSSGGGSSASGPKYY